MSDLHERIAEAHGGLERWARAERILATLSMGGAEFVYHLQPHPLEQVDVSVDLRAQRVTFSPYPEPGQTGVFDPVRVWIQDDAGQCLRERSAPGRTARSLRHWFFWDPLDVLFVAGLTVWYGVAAPFLASRSGAEREPLEPVNMEEGARERLKVNLPADVPLPAREQVLHADRRGLLRRMDYAPAAYAGVFRLGHVLQEHHAYGGLVVATRQDLYPCLPSGQLWRLTRLAWMHLDDVAVIDRAQEAVRRRG